MRHSLQVGKNYLCADWKQELVTFSEFLDRIRSNGCSPGGPTYLAQHPLFDQVFKVEFILSTIPTVVIITCKFRTFTALSVSDTFELADK